MANIKKLPLFVRCVIQNFPFIEEDFDALTNYELISKVVEFLNKVISSQNEVIGVANDLSAEFQQLHDYVANYFDNLDVQEEINNKLDAMVEAGTLQEIIGEYLNSTAVWGFDTVADMKASTNLVAGSYARTLGYASRNDGGAALYKIRESGVGDTPDEKLLVAVGDLVAELITVDKVNVCQIGGKADVGIAANYLISKGKNVYIPEGSYSTSTTIIMNQDYKQFICDGDIEFTGNNSVFAQIQCNYSVIEFNGKITCGDTNVFLQIGSGSKTVTNNTLFINRVESCKIGLWITPSTAKGVQYLDCTFSRITSAEKGIFFNPSDTGANWINECTFRGGSLHGPYGIVTRKGTQQSDQFNGIKFEHVSFNGTITLPIDVQYMRESWFNELRMNEGLEGEYIVKFDACDNIVLENQHQLWLSKISVTNTSSLVSCITIKAPYIRDADDVAISREVQYVRNNPIIPKEAMFVYKNVRLDGYLGSGGTTPAFNDPQYFYDDMIVRVGASDDNLTLSYTLPEPFRNMHSFYLLMQYKKATTSISIKTPGNTNIVTFGTGSLIDKKVYYCQRGGTYNGSGVALGEWKVSEVTVI